MDNHHSPVTSHQFDTEQLINSPPAPPVSPPLVLILIVEDSEEERLTYRRYLDQDQQHCYEIVEFDNGEDALIWCRDNRPDVLLIDYYLPDLNGLEFLQQLREQSGQVRLPAIALTGQNNPEIAVNLLKSGAEDYLDKNQITAEILHRAIAHILQQTELIKTQQWQQQRQQLLSTTALQIRQSLNLADILNTTATKVRGILNCDRVIIYQFQPDWSGLVVTESVVDPAFSILGWKIRDDCFPENYIEPYRQGRTSTIDNVIAKVDITECHREFLIEFQVQANLVVPILQQEHLWGLLIAHHCTAPRFWTDAEVELMKELATHVGIAIQQATLIEQLQTELDRRRRTEARLQQSEQKFRQLAENIQDVFYLYTIDYSELLYINPAYETLWQRPVESLYLDPKSFIETIHPDDQARINRAMQRLINQEEEFSQEYRIVRPDGSIRWIYARTFYVYNEAGEAYRIAGLASDITERKQAELALQEREETLRLLIRYSPACIAMLDQKMCYVMVSQRWVDNYRLGSMESLLGKCHYDVFPELPPSWKDTYQQCLQGESASLDEDLLVRLDGTRQWIRREVRPWYNGDQEVGGIIIFSEDVTERKKLTDSLKKSEERLRLTLELTGLGSWDVNLRSSEVIWNDNLFRLLGLEPGSVTPSREAWRQHIHPDDVEQAEHRILRAIQDQTSYDSEYRVKLPDGRSRWLSSRGEQVRDEGGQPIRMLGVVLDITERKLAELALQEREETLRLFFSYAPAGIAMFDQQMRYLMVSQRWLEDYHLSSVESVIGRSPYQIFPEISQTWRDIHKRGLAGEIVQCDEDLFTRLDGTQQWLRWEVRPWYNNKMEIGGIIIFTEDITKRKKAEFQLCNFNQELEYRILERTKDLIKVNSRLQKELLKTQRLEQELRKREKLLDGFFNAASHADVGLSIVDRNLRYLKINQALANTNGYPVEYHIGKRLVKLLPEMAPTVVPLLQHILDKGEPLTNLEISGIVPSQPGVLRYWLVSYFPIVSDTDDVIAVGNIVMEISDRKRIELEREKLIEILEATPDIVGTIKLESQQTEYINQAGRCLFGMTKDAPAADLHITDIHPDWAWSIIQQQGIPSAIRDGIWMGETAFLTTQKQEIPTSQLLIAHTFGTDQVQSISTIARDITTLKQTEAILRESERRWRSLLDHVQLIVVGLDTQGNIEYANPFLLHLTGYEESEVLGKPWLTTFIPNYLQSMLYSDWLKILAEGEHIHYQNPILTRNKEERIIAWTNTVLRDIGGQVIGTMSIGEDITERYHLERMKAEFISVVSHELRTPLTSMQAALSLLHEKIIDPTSPEGEVTISIATEGVERLVRLVNDILDLERLESGKIRLEKRFCNLPHLIMTAKSQMQEMANQGGINLEMDYPLMRVFVDPDRLLQVLINLLSNAIKFSPSHSTIKLTVKPISDPPDLKFTVADQGRGIPTEKLESIFERFQQVDASDSREKNGTGLGLAICRSIVQQHGGKIWVESQLGKGSIFYFTIPIEQEREHSSEASVDCG